MAKQRVVNTHFWNDDFILDLRADEKLLFLYILTNPQTDLCGAYQIALKRIVFDTRISASRVLAILQKFEGVGKICYRDGWMLVKNFAKHQVNNPKVVKGIERSLEGCPDWVKLALGKGFDSLSKRVTPQLQPKPQPEPTDEAAVAAATADPVETRIWKDGVQMLSRSNMQPEHARTLLGSLAKGHTKSLLAEAIAVTQAQNPADPKTFLIGVLNERSGKNTRIAAHVGKHIESPAPEYKCPRCFDTGQALVEDAATQFGWSKQDCPDCSEVAISA